MSVDWNNWDEIISKNTERTVCLFAPYDPYTGVGSPIVRFKIECADNTYMMLPDWMKCNPFIEQVSKVGITSFAKSNAVSVNEVESAITLIRIEYDFEFWAATCAKIQDKKTKSLVPFILRNPQRKLLAILMQGVIAQTPIRIILLKARQWGGSTLVQLFMAWIQLFHRKSWHSVIVADIEDQARNIRKMYTRLAKEHPVNIAPVRFRPFEGSQKNREIMGRECVVYLGSMQQPDSIRSADVMMAHLSEVGLWKETLGKKPEDIMQSIAGTIPSTEPYSIIVVESTAKGLGNFFHRAWCSAQSGKSGYEPVFVAWWEIEIYQTQFDSEDQMRAFVSSMTDTEKYYFSLGATLEGVNWYRHKKQLDDLDDWRMACEYPTTAQEAFQSTGRRAHAPQYITQMRAYCKDPLYIGDMFADGQYGVTAINKSLEFRETPNGCFRLWALPEKGYKNRYVVSLDIGGRTDGADWSVVSVIDRYWMQDAGVEECIGTWKGHLDQDLVVWKAVQIARYFCNALLVVESNSLRTKGKDGDHSLTILDEIKDDYENLYFRTDPQKIRDGLPIRYGFHTNSATKTDLVNKMNRRFRECGHIERDAEALNEADCYEIKPDGSYGAVEGEHDDIYMSRAIALLASSSMPLPSLNNQKKVRTTSHAVRTEADL